jgi:hypothetical protein
MSWQQLTFIESIFCGILIVCFAHEDKFIAFEQKVVNMIKDVIAIVKAARAQKISLKDFYYICKLCISEEIEERHPWCGAAEQKLIYDIVTTLIGAAGVLSLTIYLFQRWA